MRQHVNPLSRYFQLPKEIPGLKDLFKNPKLPIHLDIGSARGRFLLNLASVHQDQNFLGVEIRKSLVESAIREKNLLGLENLNFIFCNANVSLEYWLSCLNNKQLNVVSIQFPDPWFKRRHQKRRVLQPKLLISLAKALNPGKQIFIQSDVLSIIDPMIELIELSNCFDEDIRLTTTLLDSNPFKVLTEREEYALIKKLPIYKKMYVRNYNSPPDLENLYLDN